ncbi:hypothetical protein IL306_003762 [Fusarium sp. DS 682]|nr:hypothetical protein IL306_003762 [Fusarium sp. DS 682]
MPQLSPLPEIPPFSSLHPSHTAQDKLHKKQAPEENSTSPIMASQEANEEPLKSSMYPEFHYYVAENLEEDGLDYTFRDHDTKVDIKRTYDTKITGKFTCSRRSCPGHEWHSNSISMRIREYPNNQYNVQVYHQQCKNCKKPTRAELEKLFYADRIAYHIKRWNGIDAKQIERKVEPNGKHIERLCEGCKKGHCGKKQ